LLDFALKIAEKSYFMTVNGKPIINIDSLFDLFPQIKEVFEKEEDVEKVRKVLSERLLNYFGLKKGSELKLYKMPLTYILLLEANFYYRI
jgi:hypothetical protein